MAKKLGYDWRILAWGKKLTEKIALQHKEKDGVEFDELVISPFLHIEKMDNRTYWARIGDVRMMMHVNTKGETTVNIERGQYGAERGFTDTKLGLAGKTNERW